MQQVMPRVLSPFLVLDARLPMGYDSDNVSESTSFRDAQQRRVYLVAVPEE